MVRLGEEKDVVGILKIIRDNKHVVGIDCAEEVFSSQATSIMISQSISSNLCTVALVDDEVVGVCLGVGSINVFCNDAKQIQLIVNLITDEHKHTTLGGRNFIEWAAIVKALCKSDSKIRGVFVGQQPQGTNINFKKRGFKLSHTNWLMEIGDDDD